jgi:hypothetical protein
VGSTVIVKVCVFPGQPLKKGVNVYTKSSATLLVLKIVSPVIGVDIGSTPTELVVKPLKFGPEAVTSHE